MQDLDIGCGLAGGSTADPPFTFVPWLTAAAGEKTYELSKKRHDVWLYWIHASMCYVEDLDLCLLAAAS